MDRRFGRSREQVSRTSRATARRAIGSAPAEASHRVTTPPLGSRNTGLGTALLQKRLAAVSSERSKELTTDDKRTRLKVVNVDFSPPTKEQNRAIIA